MSLYGIGLGEMTVESSLDQPFLAEIELIDVGSDPLAGIKVGIADPEHFERIGLEPIAALSLLNFKIEKNAKGKAIIKVQSLERMTEPYMELVVDLTWPDGQLYRAYTVLLDPPGYQLVSTRAQSSPTYYKNGAVHRTERGVINNPVITSVEHNPVIVKDSKKSTTYGPTITNENVWQIAQRYKTSEVILPQIVLAIVGTNPDAFKDGNLNGLKVGVRLNIPSTKEIALVPAELATQEVMAHDNAWNEKTDINHVLTPPYINTQTINSEPVLNTNNHINSSEIPAIPKFNLAAIIPSQGTMPQLIPTSSTVSVPDTNKQQPLQNPKPLNSDKDETIKAQISITTAAVESVRESNALLMEQLHLLQDHNKKLQSQLDKRDKEIKLMQSQLKVMIKERQAIASKANSQISDTHSTSLWPLLLLFLLAAGGGGFAYWYFRIREQDATADPYIVNTPIEPKPFLPGEEQPQKLEDKVISSAIISESSPEPKLKQSNDSVEPTTTDGNDLAQKHEKANSNDVVIKPTNKHVSKKKPTLSSKAKPIIEPDLPDDIEEMTTHTHEDIPEIKEEPIKEEPVKEEPAKQEAVKEDLVTTEPVNIEPNIDLEQKAEENAHDLIQIQPTSEETESIPKINEPKEKLSPNESKIEEESTPLDLLEFESGLDQLIPENSVSPPKKPKGEDSEEHDKGLDFISALSGDQNITQEDKLNDPVKPKNKKSSVKDAKNDTHNIQSEESDLKKIPESESKNTEIEPDFSDFLLDTEQDKDTTDNNINIESSEENLEQSPLSKINETTSPLKSKKALDTLLALAKTYIGMDDIDSARFSLEEVIEFGSDSQKEEAKQLLDEIKDK